MADPKLAHTKLRAPIAVSLLVLIASLWVILSGKYAPADVAWAGGVVGSSRARNLLPSRRAAVAALA
jgi:hypothetical protein